MAGCVVDVECRFISLLREDKSLRRQMGTLSSLYNHMADTLCATSHVFLVTFQTLFIIVNLLSKTEMDTGYYSSSYKGG